MSVTEIALTLPTKRISAWMAETEPRYARAWIAALPLADSAETARELYQALYTLNRQELEPPRRFELMELYPAPVAVVTASLEAFFVRAALPLAPKKRQLADFLRQLHTEMAYGYKTCLKDLERQRIPWGKKALRAQATVRALHYLGEVLLHSYQVYMPHPAETWREIHALFDFAQTLGIADESIDVPAPQSGATTARAEYARVLLLGLSNPYQLPQNECRQVQRFLRQWAARARLRDTPDDAPDSGCFIVDLTRDAPPVPCARGISFQSSQRHRLFDVSEVLQVIQNFIQRIQKGEGARTLPLGIECLDSVCLEMLQRLLRAWGQVPRRQFSRIQRSGPVFVCSGIAALHFFAGGQKPFTPPLSANRRHASDDRMFLPAHIEDDAVRDDNNDEAFIALDEPVVDGPQPPAENHEPSFTTGDAFRVDRWKLVDTGPKGLQLSRFGGSHTCVRVGDVIGIQQLDEIGRWSAGVVRWMKSPETGSLEMGIELLAAGIKPAAVAPEHGLDEARDYQPALLLPSIEALRRPATLLLPRGMFASGNNIQLAEEGRDIRAVRLLQRLEHTNAFELLVFADIQTDKKH